MEHPVEIQDAAGADATPSAAELTVWAETALGAVGHPRAAITVRLVSEAEGRALNRDFRGRDYATNVLSFPFPEVPPEAMAELGAHYIGDLAVCAAVVQREAEEQGKPAADHWAHMVVHGVLHLVGFDHQADAEAETMEAQERAILARLGIADPYAHEHPQTPASSQQE